MPAASGLCGCATGSAGALCSRCQKGYSRTKLGGCSECKFKHGAYLVAPLFLVGVVLLVWWLYAYVPPFLYSSTRLS